MKITFDFIRIPDIVHLYLVHKRDRATEKKKKQVLCIYVIISRS